MVVDSNRLNFCPKVLDEFRRGLKIRFRAALAVTSLAVLIVGASVYVHSDKIDNARQLNEVYASWASQENQAVIGKEISFETLPLRWSAQTGPFSVDYACLVEHAGCKPRPLVKVSEDESLMLCAGLPAKSSECQLEINAVKNAQALGFVQVAENAFVVASKSNQIGMDLDPRGVYDRIAQLRTTQEQPLTLAMMVPEIRSHVQMIKALKDAYRTELALSLASVILIVAGILGFIYNSSKRIKDRINALLYGIR